MVKSMTQLANPNDDDRGLPWYKRENENWRGNQHIPFEDRMAVNKLLEEIETGKFRRKEDRFEK